MEPVRVGLAGARRICGAPWIVLLAVSSIVACRPNDPPAAQDVPAPAIGATIDVDARAGSDPAQVADHYTYGEPSADGTGKWYLGREIALVMGHQAAPWLERPGREREERSDLLLQALELESDDIVADIGAGTGYFAFPMGRLVPHGAVYAVDVQLEMIGILQALAEEKGVRNVIPICGAVDDVRLRASSVDLVLMVDAYHEFSHPKEMLDTIVRALKPGGRVVQIEYRAEDPTVPIKPLHTMSEAQARRELTQAGLEWIETKHLLPQQHMLIFRKPLSSSRRPRRDGRPPSFARRGALASRTMRQCR